MKLQRNSIDAQIVKIQAKLSEVEKALAERPNNTIPQIRKSLIDTIAIYKTQIENLRARRPLGGGRFTRSYKKRSTR
jgi:hypothetical protein